MRVRAPGNRSRPPARPFWAYGRKAIQVSARPREIAAPHARQLGIDEGRALRDRDPLEHRAAAGEGGAHLEIIEYAGAARETSPPAADRAGLRHIAFETESAGEIARLRDLIIRNGGGDLGKISEKEIDGLGTVTFVYMTDPEGNIIELLSWRTSQ